jgi:DNA repair protein RecO (recombination protein O)
MPLRETEAIVLRTYRLGEADKIVSLFSRQFGRIRAAATGAQRPKSRYGGLLEPLTYLRLWLFERENRELFRVNSAELLESFFVMQADYRMQLAAQYIAEAAERLLPEREVNERAFRLLLAVLRGLKSSGEMDRPLAYFDYWLLRLGGFLPTLNQCINCGALLEGSSVFYGRSGPGFTCARCRSEAMSASAPAALVALFEQIGKTPLPSWLSSERAAPSARDARRPLELWLEIAAERKFKSLEMLAEEM